MSTQLRYTSDGLSEITHSHPEFNLPPDLLSVGVHPQLELSGRPGHQVAFDILRDHLPRSVTYIVLGPLTNLARILRIDRALVRERIGRVVIMGGTFDVPGNITASAECEFLLTLSSRFADILRTCAQSISSLTRSPSLRFLHPRVHVCHPSACSYFLSIPLTPTFFPFRPILLTSTLPSHPTHRLSQRTRRHSPTFLARSFDARAMSCVRTAWMECSCTTLRQFGPRLRTRLG